MPKKSNRHVILLDPVKWPKSMNIDLNWTLLEACNIRHIIIAREALSQGANVNCRRSDFSGPLHIAAEHNDLELIELLCNQPSIDIELKTLCGFTPLHQAAMLGHSRAIRKLIENGASVNCVNNLGRRPLHFVAFRMDIENATTLLKNGANVNVYDAFYESPFHTSVVRRPFLPMVKLLFSHGAIINSPPVKKSLGLLLEAVLSTKNESNIKILEFLFQHGADVNTTDCIGLRTPLHLVAITGNLQLATYLIEKGADVHRKDHAGRTPMKIAIIYRHFDIVRLIEDFLSTEQTMDQTDSVTNFTSA